MTDTRPSDGGSSSLQGLLRVIAAALVILAAVAVAAALEFTRSIMVPFTFSVFLAFLVTPLIGRLREGARLPRWAAVSLVLLGVILGTALLVLVISALLRDAIYTVDLYRERLIDSLQRALKALQEMGFGLNEKQVLEQVRSLPLFTYLTRAAGKVVSLSTNTTLVIIFLIFLLMGGGKAGAPPPFFLEVALKIRRYILVKFITSAVTGMLVGIILTSFGLEMSIMFAFLTFLLNFIPTLGSIIATLLPIPVILIQFDSFWTVAVILLLLTSVQFVVGNLIDPKLLGHQLDLHPVIILIALMFWGLIWGVAGMFLAVPITVVIKLWLMRSPEGSKLAELMAGRLPGGT